MQKPTTNNQLFNSSYWLPDNTDIFKSKKDLNINDYAHYLDSISTFVRILTGRSDIKIKYNTTDGAMEYSHGYNNNVDDVVYDHIVISADLNTPQKFDITVGLTLHEAAHVVLTNTNLFNRYIKYIKLHGDAEIFDGVIPTKKDIYHFTTIFNLIEDLRVYNYILNECPGYIGYHHAMMNKYFDDEKTTTLINNEIIELPQQTWDMYLFNITNIQNPLIVKVLDRLPNLSKIYQLLLPNNINQLESSKCTINVTKKIFKLINDVVQKEYDEQQSRDIIPITIKTINEKQQDFINGKIYKAAISRKLDTAINDIVQQNAETRTSQVSLIDADGNERLLNIPCVVMKGISHLHTNSLDVQHCLNQYRNAIDEGITHAYAFASRLKAYCDKTPLTTYRVRNGKLSNRLLYSCEYNDNIFQYDTQINIPNQYIHISLDGSYSMNGYPWANTIKYAITIAKACEYISNIHVVISVRCTLETQPCMWIIYDSTKDNIDSLLTDIASIVPASNTPEGLCFNVILDDIITGANNKKSLFINFSDGMPYMPIQTSQKRNEVQFYYEGNIAITHTATMINKLKNNNIDILSYYIMPNDKSSANIDNDALYAFKQMYGNNACRINAGDITMLINTLNNILTNNNTNDQ